MDVWQTCNADPVHSCAHEFPQHRNSLPRSGHSEVRCEMIVAYSFGKVIMLCMRTSRQRARRSRQNSVGLIGKGAGIVYCDARPHALSYYVMLHIALSVHVLMRSAYHLNKVPRLAL